MNVNFICLIVMSCYVVTSIIITGLSLAVTIDSTSPIPGIVLDGEDIDLQYSTSLTNATFSWKNFSDPESGIHYFKIFIFHKPQDNSTSSLVYNATVNSKTYSSNQFSFSNGDFIFAIVEGFNFVGVSVNSSSDGYVIDITPPLIEYLFDGTSSHDLAYQSSTTSLSASWFAYDFESKIEKIKVAIFQVQQGKKVRIFPNPQFEDISYFELSNSSNNYSVMELELVHTATYVFNVLLINGAGLEIAYETNGVFIDSIRPEVSYVSVLGESSKSQHILLVKSSTMVHAEWSGFDKGSGILSYIAAIVTENGTFVTEFRDYGTSNNGIISDLSLSYGNVSNGPFYKVRVVAIDFANQQSIPKDSALF